MGIVCAEGEHRPPLERGPMMAYENHPITNADLDARLRRLEKRSRCMGAGWALTTALLGGALLIGAGEDADHPWLTVKGLTVVDDTGNPRVYLGAPVPSLDDPAQQSDATGLVLLDANGAEAASLTTKTSGASMLTVADGKTDRLALVVWPSGESGVYVLGPENMSGYRHQLAVDEDGKTYAIMRSSDGEYITRIGEPGGSGGGGQARAAQPAIPNAGQFNMPGRGGAGAAGMGGFPGAGAAGMGGFPGAGAAGMGGFPGAGGAGAGAAGMGGFPGAGAAGAGGAPGAGEMPDIEEMRRQMVERMNLPPEEKQKLLERMEEQARLMEERRAGAAEESEDEDASGQDDDSADTDDSDSADSEEEDGAEEDSTR